MSIIEAAKDKLYLSKEDGFQFVLDKSIKHENNQEIILKKDFLDNEKVETYLERCYENGVEWIHANLILDKSLRIITLICGAPGNCSVPSLNISFQEDINIRII